MECERINNMWIQKIFSKNEQINYDKWSKMSQEEKQKFLAKSREKLAQKYKLNVIPQMQNNGLVGIKNEGNNCYIAVVLQCLQSTEQLSRLLLQNVISDQLNTISTKSGGNLICEFRNFLIHIWGRPQGPYDCAKIKAIVALDYPEFKNDLQQDAQEFFSAFLNILVQETNKVFQEENLSFPSYKGELLEDYYTKCIEEMDKQMKSILKQLYYGNMSNRIICPDCGYFTVDVHPFNTISLNIPQIREVLFECFLWLQSGEKYFLVLDIEIDQSLEATLQKILGLLKKKRIEL